MGIEQNKNLVRKFFELVTIQSPAAWDLVADDATWWVPGNTPFSGTHTKREFLPLVDKVRSLVESSFPEWPTGMTAEGDYVAAEAESYTTVAGGKVYQNKYHFLFHIKDGLIRSCREYLDTVPIRELLSRGQS